MALVSCPECGDKVADRAPRCLHCGARANRGVRRLVLWLGLAMSALGVILVGAFYDPDPAFSGLPLGVFSGVVLLLAGIPLVVIAQLMRRWHAT